MGILDAPARDLAARARATAVGLGQFGGVPVLSALNGYDRISNGTDTGHNGRRLCTVLVDCNDLRFVYGNFYNNEQTPVPNPITIRAALMDAVGSGRFWPIYFGGVRDVTIEPGEIVVSDPVSYFWAAASTFFITTYVTARNLGDVWPYGPLINTGISEYGEFGTTIVDRTTTVAFPGDGAGGHIYGPLTCFATVRGGMVANVALVGDSIIYGSNDALTYGYAPRALDPVAIPWVSIAMGGENGYEFIGQGSVGTENRGRLRRQLVGGCTHAIEAYGHNDFNAAKTVAQTQTAVIAIWRDLWSRGMKVWRVTLLPDTSSTDSWATTVNQTARSWESNRTTFNDWIRDGSPLTSASNFAPVATGGSGLRAGQAGHPLAGYFETADVVESARNSGKWKVNGSVNWYTNDGTHPQQVAHIALAAAIDTTKFRI